MTTSGKVTKVTSNPRGCLVQPPGDPAPPPVAFTPLDADAYAAALAAYTKGSDVDVDGTPPNATNVTCR